MESFYDADLYGANSYGYSFPYYEALAIEEAQLDLAFLVVGAYQVRWCAM